MNFKKIFKNRLFLTVFIATLIFVIIYTTSNFFYTIDSTLRNFSIKFKNQTYTVDTQKKWINPDLVFIEIDEKTIGEFGFPMPRSQYVPLIEHLNEAGAEIIGFDIIFANTSTIDPKGDEQLAAAIEKAGNIVLGGAVIENTNPNIPSHAVIELPLEKFYKNTINFGYYKPTVDSRTNVVKTFVPEVESYATDGSKRVFKHFSLAVLEAYYSKIYNQHSYIGFVGNNKDKYELKPKHFLPYANEKKQEININFIQQPKEEELRKTYFPTYSFLDVYKGNIEPEVFKGKIVLIGATAKGLKDTFNTPNGIEYGVFVLGNIVNTVLTKNYLIDFSKRIEWVLIYLLLLISVYFNLSRSGYILIFSNVALAGIFLVIYPLFMLFTTSFLLNYIFELFLALLFSLSIGNIAKYLLENKDRKKLGKALSEYVSKAIAQEILTSKGDINLNGEEKELAVFFSDIEGFTTISEKFTPQKLVAFLREYLQEMSTVILDKEGFINKYEGDAIMGLWGVFNDQSNKKDLACRSALEQQKLLSILNQEWSKIGLPEIRVRIGLHSGTAIVGNIGAQGRKMEYTALGDNINLASRLEGVNKFYGTYICVSEEIQKDTDEEFGYRFLDNIKVKGKDKPIKIYELIDLKSDLSERWKQQIQDFKAAYDVYKNGDMHSAKKMFECLEKQGDIPSKTYVKRCKEFIQNGVPKDWDGVWTFDEK